MVTKAAQAKIDELVANDMEKDLPDVNAIEFSSDEIQAEFDPDSIKSSDEPHIEIESIDTVIDETFDPILATISRYRETGIIFKNKRSLRIENFDEIFDRVKVPDKIKNQIKNYLKIIDPNYSYIYFNEEAYGNSIIENFIVFVKKEYNSEMYILGSQYVNITPIQEISKYKDTLKFELLERINKLQFYQKNLNVTIDQYLSGSDIIDVKELKIPHYRDFL